MTEQPSQPLAAAEPSLDAKNATVADLMSPALGVFRPDMTVAQTVEELRELTRSAIITYCYVTDGDGKLVGVVVMRDMLLADARDAARGADADRNLRLPGGDEARGRAQGRRGQALSRSIRSATRRASSRG